MKTLETVNAQISEMTLGQSMLFSIKGTSTSKIQLTIVDKQVADSTNPLSILNASDSRFSTNKPFRAWLSAEPTDAIKYFPQHEEAINTAAAGDKNTEVFIGEINPTLNGNLLKVQIVETITPTEYQAENVERTAKRAGQNGAILTYEGSPIFRNSQVVLNTVNNVLLKADTEESATTSRMVITEAEELVV